MDPLPNYDLLIVAPHYKEGRFANRPYIGNFVAKKYG